MHNISDNGSAVIDRRRYGSSSTNEGSSRRSQEQCKAGSLTPFAPPVSTKRPSADAAKALSCSMPSALTMSVQAWMARLCQLWEKRQRERKDPKPYTSGHQLDEKPNVTLGCPGASCGLAKCQSQCPVTSRCNQDCSSRAMVRRSL